jgi:hypothetical protein
MTHPFRVGERSVSPTLAEGAACVKTGDLPTPHPPDLLVAAKAAASLKRGSSRFVATRWDGPRLSSQVVLSGQTRSHMAADETGQEEQAKSAIDDSMNEIVSMRPLMRWAWHRTSLWPTHDAIVKPHRGRPHDQQVDPSRKDSNEQRSVGGTPNHSSASPPS